jgi:hypothetical protein
MSNNNEGAWITTYTGKRFHLLNPSPEEIDIIDIGKALSNIVRFTGQLEKPYTVAQHSVYVSYEVPLEAAFAALLHDASEAYINDISRPFKHTSYMEGYRVIENLIQDLVYQKFGVPNYQDYKDIIKDADLRVYAAEVKELRGYTDPEYAHVASMHYPGIKVLSHKHAYQKFMNRFYSLAPVYVRSSARP